MYVFIMNSLEVISRSELECSGLTYISTNLAGENVYKATDKAIEQLLKEHRCYYENDNGDHVKAT